jgi:hypothetical protein
MGYLKKKWLKNLCTWFSMTTTELFRTAVNKVKLANMIANVWNRSAHEEEEERKHLNCQSKVLTL